MTEVAKPVLSAAAAKKYECTRVPGKMVLGKKFGGGDIDLTTISLEKADELVIKGFPYLKPKAAAVKEAAAEAKK